MLYRPIVRTVSVFVCLISLTSCSFLNQKGITSEPVRREASQTPLLIPRPKFAAFDSKSGGFTLTKDTVLVVADRPTREERLAVDLLRREIAQRFDLKLPQVTVSGEKNRKRENRIVLAVGPTPKSRVRVPQRPEGYALSASPKLVQINGNDGRGVLWGVQTLLQLFGPGAAVTPVAPAVAIRDWPTLSLRAVHLFQGQNALPFHQKLIDRIFSRYKMNALFLESEQSRWNHDPKVAPEWSGSRAQIKAEVEYARERGVTVYPLMQSYGHMAWLLDNDRNRGMAEDPKTPYAVNYSDPKAVAYMEGFNREADDLFGAPGFHIGLDEVTMRGRFPYRSRPKTFPQMYVQAATHWHGFFQKRGKPLYMWADMALCANEENPDFGTAPSAAAAKAVREGLPKDIIMMDWQYGERKDFPSLRRLKAAGFKNVVAATWYRPKNIQNFALAANEAGALGAIQTTWAGYDSQESILDTEHRQQFTAMILAAEYFWNGGEGLAPDKLPYDPKKVFAEQWKDSR